MASRVSNYSEIRCTGAKQRDSQGAGGSFYVVMFSMK